MKLILRRSCYAAMTMAAFVVASTSSALACACCTETAWRYVATEGLSTKRTAEIEQMRFAKAAKLMAGTDEDRRIKGVKDAGESYQLELARANDLMTFSFRDEMGRPGTLAFRMPNTISIFEVDPRGAESDKGLGPSLYKEWKITAYSTKADGLFKAAVSRNTKMTLVLHGRGNGCTSADQFTDWTLQVYGPPGKFTLYGKLDPAGQ